MFVKDPIHTFYLDIPQPLAETYASRISSQAYSSICTPTLHEGWRGMPITYILCGNDKAVDPDMIQRPTVAFLRKHGYKERLEVVETDSSHSPFLSQASLCTKVIEEAVLMSGDAGM